MPEELPERSRPALPVLQLRLQPLEGIEVTAHHRCDNLLHGGFVVGVGLISDGEAWMEMIRHRNLSTHTYDEATVQEIVTAVVSRYIDAFQELESRLRHWERRP